jgi:hypothetical protein
VYGRAAHQAPETDGQVRLTEAAGLRAGQFVDAKVIATEGVDLVAEPLAVVPGAPARESSAERVGAAG